MATLEREDLQEILKGAASAITDPRDKETAERLVASLSLGSSDIDHKRIASILARAGKVEECNQVVAAIEKRWERADVLCTVARGLIEGQQNKPAMALLTQASTDAVGAQHEGSEMDQLSACAVLADIVEMYAQAGDFKKADKLASEMRDPIRQQRAMERVNELRPPQPEKKTKSKRASKKQA